MADQHLRSLLEKLEALTPLFGRARPDLEAIASRANNADYRGVLQNARLVVEALLRAIMHREKNQDPGKAMLDQLLSKLYQQGKPSVLPTHIVVHMRTIQAWGNVGAHDQSADLFSEGISVSMEEARASLSALLVILEWYRDAYLQDGPSGPAGPAQTGSAQTGASGPSQPANPNQLAKPNQLANPVQSVAATPQTHTEPKPKKSSAAVVAGGVVLVGIGAAVVLMSGPMSGSMSGSKSQGPGEQKPPVDRTALDAAYKAAKEPLPPRGCADPDAAVAPVLAKAMGLLASGKYASKRPEDQQASKLLQAVPPAQRESTEYWAMVARARLNLDAGSEEVLEAAHKASGLCKSYAVPHNLKGHLHIHNNELDAAKKAYERAKSHAADYVAPRYNLGLIHLKSGEADAAIRAFSEVLQKDPAYGLAYQMRGTTHLTRGRLEEAHRDLKKALQLQPKSAQTLFMMGSVLTKQNAPAEAKAAFCRAKALGHSGAAKFCP